MTRLAPLARFAAALRGFARGFLGLAAPAPDAATARRRLEEAAARRPRCC